MNISLLERFTVVKLTLYSTVVLASILAFESEIMHYNQDRDLVAEPMENSILSVDAEKSWKSQL